MYTLLSAIICFLLYSGGTSASTGRVSSRQQGKSLAMGSWFGSLSSGEVQGDLGLKVSITLQKRVTTKPPWSHQKAGK